MSPKKQTAAKASAKNGSDPKAASCKKAAKAAAKSSNFDQEAEMEFINQKLGEAGDQTGVPDESHMRALATPQKSKPPVVPTEEEVVVEAHDGQGHGEVAVDPADQPSKTRKNMCTPDKASTPVKSPFCKKGRVGSAKKGAVDETADATPMDTESPVKSLTLEYDADAAMMEHAEQPTLETILEHAQSSAEGGDVNGLQEAMSTASTIPDPELESKLFMKMLLETSDEDVLRKEILGWVSKRSHFHEPGYEMLPKNLANQCRLIQEFMESAQLLGFEKKGLEEDMHKKVEQFTKGYDQMLKKLQENHPDDPSVFEKKKGALDKWVHEKKTGVLEPVQKVQLEINRLEAELSKVVGKVIEEKGKPDPTSEPQLLSQGTQEMEDAVTKEIEELMNGMVIDETTPGDSLVVVEAPEKVSQMFDDRNPDDSPDGPLEPPPGLDKAPEDGTTGLDKAPEDGTTGLDKALEVGTTGLDKAPEGGDQSSGSSQNVALTHIKEMPDGPAKSALLAILEATAQQGHAANGPEPMDGVIGVIRRQDTTQLQAQQEADDPDAVQQPDGSWMWKGPKGRLETWDQRQKRLAHNTRMCFNRSFGSDCPDAVLQKAATRRYNSRVIQELFEDWLASGKNWMASATHLNATRASEQKRRGKHVMRPKTWLVEKYGEGVAATIIAEKRAMQQKRQPADPIFCMRNPDLPQSEDHELFRVFDSLEFEDAVTDKVETGFSASGQMNETQTREFMPVMMQGMKDMDGAMQYMTPGTGSGQGNTVETKNGKPGKPNKETREPVNQQKPREKKVKGLKQQASGKIQVCSAKLTDIKIWSNKVTESPLSEDMKKGYMAELQSREKEFQDTKAELETLYMRKETEEEINGNGQLKAVFEETIMRVEGLTSTYAGTVKSVKLAVEPPKPKAKSRAKKGKTEDEPAA